jgi:hypothetical protein
MPLDPGQPLAKLTFPDPGVAARFPVEPCQRSGRTLMADSQLRRGDSLSTQQLTYLGVFGCSSANSSTVWRSTLCVISVPVSWSFDTRLPVYHPSPKASEGDQMLMNFRELLGRRCWFKLLSIRLGSVFDVFDEKPPKENFP